MKRLSSQAGSIAEPFPKKDRLERSDLPPEICRGTFEEMDILGQDIRYSVRMLVKNPVTTGVAILSLALGIGANTAIFSLMNTLILRSLPIRDPEQLVRLSTAMPQKTDTEGSLSLAMYQQIRKDQRVFSDLFAWDG